MLPFLLGKWLQETMAEAYWEFCHFLQRGKNSKLLTGKNSLKGLLLPQSFSTVCGVSFVNINLNDIYPAIWRSHWSVNNNDNILTIINELLGTSARFYIIILNLVQFLVLRKPEVIEMLFSFQIKWIGDKFINI